MSEHDTPEGGPGGPAEEADDPLTAATMQTLAPMLRDPAVWAEPAPTLIDSIVAAIAAERDAQPPTADAPFVAAPTTPPPTVPPPATTPPPATDELSSFRARREQRRRPAVWTALAAAAAVAAIAIGVVAVTGGGDEGGDQLAIGPTDVIPEASATAEVSEFGAGVAIELDVSGLPPAPEGQYYAGWLRNEAGDLVGIGSFHMRGGDAKVTLWSGVRVEDYPTLSVTIQTEGEGEASSGEAVLRGSLTD